MVFDAVSHSFQELLYFLYGALHTDSSAVQFLLIIRQQVNFSSHPADSHASQPLSDTFL